MARSGYSKFKKPKEQGRGELQVILTDGPHVEWLGMPEYYKHDLTIEGESYAYYSAEKDLGFEVGEVVVFRYSVNAKGRLIDKRSLGKYIDPATYNS